MAGPLLLLGPQRPNPNVDDALARVGGEGPVVTITAGWRLDEHEHGALHEVIGSDAVNLPLYQWFEECMEGMPDTRDVYKVRQSQLMRLKRVYRERLHRALEAVRALILQRDDHPEILNPQLEWALDDVRRIDQQFVDQSRAIFGAYPEVGRPWELDRVAERRQESAELLSSARAVVIAGGHVAVLRNRMMFFGIHQQLFQAWAQHTGVVAWGAGSMLLTDRIVLFYDDPPDGPSHPEILDTGLALLQDTVLLPDAVKRLRLDDRMRVALLGGRFRPALTIGMENGAWLELEDGRLVQKGTKGSAQLLQADGEVVPLEDAE
jgi:peptidase E